MDLFDALKHILSEYALGFSILLGSVVGVMATLARALRSGIIPDTRWWLERGLLFGFFALATGWAAEITSLSNVGAAFLASLLNLMGLAALEIIERRAKRVLEGEQP